MAGNEEGLEFSRLADHSPPHPDFILGTRVDPQHPVEIQRVPGLPEAAVVVVFEKNGKTLGHTPTKLPAFARIGSEPDILDIGEVVREGMRIVDKPLMDAVMPKRVGRTRT